MNSDLISIVFQIMHLPANVWDREGFRNKGRKKVERKEKKKKKRMRDGTRRRDYRCGAVRRQGSPLPLPTFVDIEYLGLSITSPISESIGLIFVSISCTDL